MVNKVIRSLKTLLYIQIKELFGLTKPKLPQSFTVPMDTEHVTSLTNGNTVHASLASTTIPEEEEDESPNQFMRYGELELFLCGLDLSDLIQLVHSHRIEFPTFLRMTEEDLINVRKFTVQVLVILLVALHYS